MRDPQLWYQYVARRFPLRWRDGQERCEVVTAIAWAVWEPLIEEVGPRGKTPPNELRRPLPAIVWRHQHGAKWRSISAELGPWRLAAQVFIRWAKPGVS